MKLISIHDNTQYGKGNVVRHEPTQTWVKILAIDPICRVVTVRWPDGRQQHVAPEELEMKFVEGWAGRVLVKPETGFVNEPSALMQSMSQSDAERLTARDMHGARAGIKQAEMVMPGPYSGRYASAEPAEASEPESFDVIRTSAITTLATEVLAANPPNADLGTMKGIRQIWVSDAEFETLKLALLVAGSNADVESSVRDRARALLTQVEVL